MAKVYRLCKKGKRTGQRNLYLDNEGAGYTPLLYPVSMSVIQHLAGLFTRKENSREACWALRDEYSPGQSLTICHAYAFLVL